LSLITGITGSGKSTTLDSIIDHHNKIDPCHIIIIAAPIEYVHTSNISLIKHREVGRDVLSFKEGIVQSLRQDPDIIVVGEMRDPDTIMAALEVTDTGHKVFSTLHTSSAVESIDRIIAECDPAEQERVRNRLADVLISVVSQKLVPSLDGKRVLAKEVLLVTPSVRAAIKNNNTSEIYMMINQGGAQGMITMEQDLKRLYLAKKISLETAITYANNKTRIQQILAA
jgi:twitching motility protein PilT